MNRTDSYGAIVMWVDRAPVAGPLDGLRVGVKDLIAVAGVPRLCGMPAIADPAAQKSDAEAVARLVAAGGHIVATTATHPFGWGVTTPGTTNPREPGLMAGGSSGGSAAALAAGIVDGALGTDTAGSIRIPAACCGVVGLRPSEGLVPRGGVQPLAPSLDVVGPMARDVRTTARLLTALTGRAFAPAEPATLRVGVPTEVEAAGLHAEVRRAWMSALDLLRRAGADVRPVTLPTMAAARDATMTVLAAEEAATHVATLAESSHHLSDGVIAALQEGRSIPNARVLDARRELALFRDALGGVFSRFDVLVLPVLTCRVPAEGARTVDVDGETQRVGDALTRLNSPFSGAGVPAGAVPVGRDSNAAPIGLQVIAAWQRDETVLATMALLERLSGGPWPPVADVSR